MTLVDVDSWTILSPVSTPHEAGAVTGHRLGRPLAGTRVGLHVETAWDSYKPIMDEWERLLGAGGAAVADRLWLYGELVGGITYTDRSEPQAMVDAWAETVDCAIVGLGNCGGCAAGVVTAACGLEAKGLPVVAVVTEQFEDIGRYVREHLRHPDLNLLVLPYPLEHEPEEYLRQVAREAYPRILAMVGAS